MPSRRALGLPELLISLGLFSVVALVSYLFLDQGVDMWKNVTGTEAAAMELRKAQRFLEPDLLTSSSGKVQEAQVGASLPGGAPEGEAIWFLSARDGASGEVVRKTDGRAFWQRNILYYAVVPAGHTECRGGAGPGGLDDRCPHKVLIRKVIDTGAATRPGSDPLTTEEALLTDPTPYLTRPVGSDVNPMKNEPGVEKVEIVAVRLLWFEVGRGVDPRWPEEVQVDMRAVSLQDARQKVKLGVDSLKRSPYTVHHVFSVFPRN